MRLRLPTGYARGQARSIAAHVALFATVTVAYFFAARLGLHLITEPEGVAVFWPAAGVAAGALIALGRGARWPVALGVMIATVAANVMGDRTLWTGLAFAACNAGEALLLAWLIERLFGGSFRLDSLVRTLGFLFAAAVAASVAAVGAALGIWLLHSHAPVLDAWRFWAVSDALGIITVAPLLIGLAEFRERPPPVREAIEGLLGLAAVAIAARYVFTLPSHSWIAAEPVVSLFPLLLWIAARYRPPLTGAAIFVVAITLVWSTTFGLGTFGDPAVPLEERILAAQAGLFAAALCALVLASLFAERRIHEAALDTSNKRLELALAGAELGVWEIDVATGRLTIDERCRKMHGLTADASADWRAAVGTRVDPADRPRLRDLLASALQSGSAFRAEYRVKAGPEGDPPGERWITVEGSVVRDADGRAIQVLGVSRDITGSKRAEAAIRESETRLREALAAGQVMAFEWDAASGVSRRSRNAADILGFQPAEGPVSSRGDFLVRVHPDDRKMFVDHVNGLSPRRPQYVITFRFIRPDGRTIWLEESAMAEFDGDGRLVRIKGLTRDITERKIAETHQNLLVAELDHRVKNVLARVAIVAQRTRETSHSMEEFVAALQGRILSMANAHALLSRSRWHGVSLVDLVRQELAPYRTVNNVRIEGPNVVLSATMTQALAMVLHELVTNAVKYGALSKPAGHVSVWWDVVAGDSGSARLHLHWKESGGTPPTDGWRPGYGTSVIRDLIPHQLDGRVDLEFASGGVACAIEFPIESPPSPVRAASTIGL